MSIHKSLVVDSGLTRARNVLKRVERLDKLTKDGKWKEGDSVYSLPKVKARAKIRKAKKEKKADEAAAAETAAPAAEAAKKK